jgi:hypothetical protein
MINLVGKTLALTFVGLAIVLMIFAAAVYFNAVDIGWKQPARVYRETDARKPGDLGAVAGEFDKHDAAARKLVRMRYDSLVRLGNAQASFLEVEPYLGDNRLKGDAVLEKLYSAPESLVIRDLKFEDNGALVLEPGTNHQLGFPVLDPPIKEITKSYKSYLVDLDTVNKKLLQVLSETADVLHKEKDLTDRMIGEVDKDGKSSRENGAVVRPGWYYLLEVEAQAQIELKKEIEYIQPLWTKELIDAQGLVSRRDVLLRRLNELGDKGYLSQSEYLRKIK